MYKLVILIEPPDDADKLDAEWPAFLKQCEQMPGLRRETTSRVDRLLHGRYHLGIIHELFFDSMDALKQAMNSDVGQETGRVLQRITDGKFSLLMADHLEDQLSNIRVAPHFDD
ncbi:MAG: hypothetical protein EPO32_09010 [Anaerolineae bacterium]|nr:MAG: hypothetical protein EPO32_09010 [Anaerolineae bacterium]